MAGRSKADRATRQKAPRRAVSSGIYDTGYYLTINEGGALGKQDNTLTPRLQCIFDMADPGPRDTVLDVGCGTGEICFNAALRAKRVIGIDYSEAAIAMCEKKLKQAPLSQRKKISFHRADATRIASLPIPRHSVNKVIMTDVVEHLYPEQLEAMLRGIKELLADDATIYIHTTPNLDFYKYGYPVIRFMYPVLSRIGPARDLLWTKPNWRGRRRLPKDPEEGSHNKLGHVNEQTPRSLKATLEKCGYAARVKVLPFLRVSRGALMRLAYAVLRIPPLKQMFGAEIVASATVRR